MLHGLTGWHLLIVLAVILLLFGAAKLPALAQSLGQSARVFRGEIKAMKDDGVPEGVDPSGGIARAGGASAGPFAADPPSPR